MAASSSLASSFTIADLNKKEREHLDVIRQRKTELLGDIQRIQDELLQVNGEIVALDGFADDSQLRIKQLACGKRKFNLDPERGLRYLYEHHLLLESADSVARFLNEGSEGLRKAAVGDFLGERRDFNLAVLEAYVRAQDFQTLTLVDALRCFLSKFRLPGEAQKIDRIMEQFARHYCRQNPHLFSGGYSDTFCEKESTSGQASQQPHDACYTLCYATIMLNTSLHNPNVRERMTPEAFQQLCAGMRVDRELVTTIYNAIRAEPFRLPQEEDSLMWDARTSLSNILLRAEKQGWLFKQGSRFHKVWNRRWFVLHGKCLYYFEHQQQQFQHSAQQQHQYSNQVWSSLCESGSSGNSVGRGRMEPRGIISIDNLRVRVVTTDEGRPHIFEIYPPRGDGKIKACKRADSEGRLVEGQHQVYRMAAVDQQDMLGWISAIQRAISRDYHLAEVMQARRKRISAGASDPTLNKLPH